MILNLEPERVLLILAGTVVLATIGIKAARGSAQKLMLLGLLSGLAWYSGVGAADSRVAGMFIWFYFGLVASIIFGFHLFRTVFSRWSVSLGATVPPALGPMSPGRAWLVLIAIYVLLGVFPLLWPTVRVDLLISPPAPDLLGALGRRFTETPDVLTRLVGYVQLLLTPFFFVALYTLRFRLRWICVIFAVLLYLRYVANAYIGRGEIMTYVCLMVLAIWVLRPHQRRVLLICGLAVFPAIVYGLFWYGMARLGGELTNDSLSAGVALLLTTELGFPRDVGMVILSKGARVDFASYLTWIFTLPIPKILTGAIEGARINYEISEIVLGRPIGSYGWYVVLPGLVAESVYIYGPIFFWMHGVFVGAAAAFFVRMVERVPQFVFLRLYVVFLFAYALNRGGISSLLPPLINWFLVFYVYLALVVLWPRSSAPPPISVAPANRALP